jgi:hypothetical protein
VPTAATAGETWWRAKQRADGCEVTKKPIQLPQQIWWYSTITHDL